MKLWQIKAMALRLMFSDTDMQFNESEFSDGILMNNSNTREKLIGMDDSIRRAIDRYNEIIGEQRTVTEVESTGVNEINLSGIEDMGIPERIDVKIYTSHEDVKTLYLTHRQVNFVYDHVRKRIFFDNEDYSIYGLDVSFVIWYKMKKMNIPYVINDMEYDLDTLLIPEEVQRMLPYFVKGELYEEDEPTMAQTAMAMYINFLRGLRKPFSNVQTKIKRARVFTKDN